MTDSHIATVQQLSEWLQGTDITLLELSGPGNAGVRLSRAPRPTDSRQEATSTIVRANSVGVVLHAHPLRTEPLVRVGQQVAAGETVALLRLGLVLLPVPAPRAGVVQRVLAAHEATVGFGEPLIELA